MTTKRTTGRSRATTKKSPKTPARPATKRTAAKPAAKPRNRATGAAATGAPPHPAHSPRAARRAIFIDVENTSSEESLSEVLAALHIDHIAQRTELTAVGNWRAIGQRMGRHLAGLGAQLVHSAPATGVRDWSDLWIAVAAGCWLGQSSPGDVLEIVSNDRAFDAVGDAAAARGVVYRRLQHRRGEAAVTLAAEARPAARRTRGGRRRRGRGRTEHASAAAVPAVIGEATAQRPAPHPDVEPHGATGAQMLTVIDRLTSGDPSRWVNLDVLEKALKAEGFSRPLGSPRLVTRLRMLKEVEVDSHGRVRRAPGMGAAPSSEAEAREASEGAPTDAAPKRRRRKRSKPAAAARESERAPAHAAPSSRED